MINFLNRIYDLAKKNFNLKILSEKTKKIIRFFNLFAANDLNYLNTFHPVTINLLKVNNGKTRKMYKTCSKLTIKTPKRRQ